MLIWIFDLEDLGILAVNDAAIDHHGYSEEEILFMTIRDICDDSVAAG